MQIEIRSDQGVPIYLQIVNQVKYLVGSGRLEAGEEMPPIRVLAKELLINPNTVARAYMELERAGIVEKHHGSGTVITDTGSPLTRRERVRILTEKMDALIVDARNLNFRFEEVLELIEQRNQHLKPEGKL